LYCSAPVSQVWPAQFDDDGKPLRLQKYLANRKLPDSR
jgi:hypothetical protein